MPDLFLGIDLGTASSKGIVTDATGAVVAQAARPHGMDLPRPGWAEVDAEAVWWGDVAALSRELTGRVGADRIAGMCVSGVGPCLVACDDALRPLRPAILYGIDSRATAEITELTDRLGADAIVERGGKALSSQAVGPKLLWLRRHEPDVWAATTRWFSCSSYAVAKLTGAYVLDHQTASQCDPLYDLRTMDWARDVAAGITGDLPLPELAWPGEVAGAVHAAAAAETGLRPGTPVVAGTVDAWAEAYSVGVRRPGDLMLMYGSTVFLVQVLAGLRVHPGVWATAGVERGQLTLAAGTSTSGSLTGWLRDVTGGAPYEQLVREAAAVPAGADGLVMLPYFAGERTPLYDPRARGVIAGLTLRHGRGHLYRAALEGTALAIRQILSCLDEAAGEPARRIVAVGGGTQGGLWTQIVSDVTGREQLLPAQAVGASYGGALLAAVGTGAVAPETDWTTQAGTVRPDPATAAVYDALYDTFTELYPATRTQVHRLADLQEQTP
ncbi:FGGY-family carbohydrate kinase [Spirilliplanes yamanashiensis]|uniref:Sugar kinase n=1 Tax=Spirilliplanes yamanashiensis TaxID=42233 RepID=A0A8J4DKM4_9ACTN|nr:FGGY-family carbohydrate kinase [Spirilliplanes yamanashiensis]MDP9817614.1 xylulokinase [Spirilliplanes yamanashiensis]GIJ04424.1 sugar kinase [Spirilliplanes yamanashiensis]